MLKKELWVGKKNREVGGKILILSTSTSTQIPNHKTSKKKKKNDKMASKEFIEETDKNFEFITEKLFRLLGFGDMAIPIVTENQALVLF